MADNGTNTTGDLGLGDLGQIRNILMGQQMSAYDAKFKELEDMVAVRSKEITQRLDELDKQSQKAMDNLEKGATANIDRLEKMVEKRLEQLTKRLDDTSVKDKAKIGKLLADMGKKLMDA